MSACRRYGLLLSVLGGALCVAAGAAPSAGAAALVGWFGATALLIAVLYFLKDRGGAPERLLRRLPALHALVFLPYTMFGLTVLLLSRLVSREPVAQEIAPRVWLGGAPLPWNWRALHEAGIDCVLNLCIEFPDLAGFRSAGYPYRRVAILDGAPPHPEQLREAVEWAAERHGEGRTVYVHCAQGHGRSATAATALLVRLGIESDPDAARERIKAIRPETRVAARQREVVAAYCRGLSGPSGSTA